MGFIRRQYEKYKTRAYHTFFRTHFTIKPIKYTFVTELPFGEVDTTIEREAGLVRNIKRYNVLMGHCHGNRITFYRLTFSAKFLIMMRPFQAYMQKLDGKTVITGTFRFSTSTMILFAVWMMNDLWKLIESVRLDQTQNIFGHIISLTILPIFLVRMVWKDKKTQNMIIHFMEKKLNAKWVRES